MKKNFITKTLCIIMAIMLAIPISVGNFVCVEAEEVVAEEVATSGTCGDSATWVYDEATATLTISGTGGTGWYSSSTLQPWVAFKESLKTVVIESGITELATSMFENFTAIEEVSLPDTLTTINSYSFSGCTSLKSIVIPNSVVNMWYGAFSGCTALENVTLSTSLKSIPSNGFKGCTSLTSIEIPESVTSIEGSAFYGCSKLTSVTLSEGLTSIGDDSFRDCTALTNITLPRTLKQLVGASFYNCAALKSIEIPEGVTSIGNSVFNRCSALESVTLPSSLTNIGSLAFYDCKALVSIDLPDGLTELSNQLFDSCDLLETVGMPATVTTFGDSVFRGCTALKNVEIPATVTAMGDYVFENCASITSVEIPASVTTLGQRMFSGCSSLASVTLNEGLTAIGEYAFSSCTSLTSIALPESVETLGNSAFYGCSKLASITGGSKLTADTIGNNAFYNTAWIKNGNAILNGILYGCAEEISEEGLLDLSGLAITALGNSLFSYKSAIITVKLPTTLTHIGNSVFYGCTGLISVQNVSNINYIGNNAFYNCTSLETFGEIAEDAYVAVEAFKSTPYLLTNGVSGTCGDNIQFKIEFGESLTSADAVLTITGTGEITCERDKEPWKTYKDLIQKVEIGEGITALSEYAFNDYSALEIIEGGDDLVSVPNTSVYGTLWYNTLIEKSQSVQLGGVLVKYAGTESEVTLTDSIKAIEAYAFHNNTTLTKAILPDGIKKIGNNAFYGCTALTEVNLPEGLEEIGRYAFYNTALSAIRIPATVLELKNYTFANCSNLKEVEYSDSLVISDDAFWNSPYKNYYGTCGDDMTWKFNGKDTITISGSGEMSYPWWSNTTDIVENTTTVIFNGEITSIYSGMFKGMTKLSNVTIPDTVTEIEADAFRNTAITSINLPEGLTSIGMRAFANTKLTSVVIPSTVTDMDSYVFENCTDLASVEVKGSEFNQYALNGCTALKEISLNCETIKRQAFYGNTTLETFVIGPNVKTIEEYAFKGATGLKSITFAEGSILETIKYNAFEGCTNLEEIHFPASLKTIEENAFDGCSSLNKVTFREGIETIGAYAFVNCPALKEASIPKSIVTIGEYAFNGYSELFADYEGGKEYYHYYANSTPFTMYGYINTDAERYAASGYNVKFESLGGSIEGCVLVLDTNSYTYDGTAKKPAATLKSKYKLVTIKPVAITYADNINIGTATVVATYIGDFYESNGSTVTTTFTINEVSSGGNSGSVSSEIVEKAIQVLEEYGFNPNDIIYAESDEVALAIAEEYAMKLAEIDPSFASLTAEDLVKALRGSGSTGGDSTKPDNDASTNPDDNTSTKPGDNTSTGGNTGTQQPSTHIHNYTYKSNDDATVLADGTKTGTCICGNVITVPDTGSKLAASIKVPAKSFAMKVKQTYKGFRVTMGKGDSIKSVKLSSSSKKLIKVSKINKSKGTFAISALKKTGKAKVTITLASGKKQTLTIKVQKKDVKTTKISGLKSKITLKKGKSTTLKPVITPITSKQKVKFKTSNKKIATVSSKGVIKAKKKGKATITVTSGSKKKTVKVTVK